MIVGENAEWASDLSTQKERGLHIFQVSLDMEDARLCVSQGLRVARPGKPTLKHNGDRFGHDDDPFADLPAEEVGGGGFAAAGATGQGDAETRV